MPKTTGVLFVCLGNICRSPMAEAVFVHMIEERGVADRFVVESAGLGAWHVGEEPDRRTISVLKAHGMRPRSTARQVRTSDFDRFDHILVMDDENMVGIRPFAGGAMNKVSMLLSWDPNAPRRDVPDPYYGDIYDFEQVFALVHSACAAFLDRQS